jgi:hypothetical protein
MSLTLPIVHINGTSRDTLRAKYLDAYHKLLEFREAFACIEFHARDYYVQGPAAFSQARIERDRESQRLGDLMTYLEAHLIHLNP